LVTDVRIHIAESRHQDLTLSPVNRCASEERHILQPQHLVDRDLIAVWLRLSVSHAANGIWLCSACADLIDKDEERFPVTIIQEWKSEAEAAATRGIKGALADPPDAMHQIPGPQNLIGCPFCHTVSESDVNRQSSN
jgi:hypothetical protein